MTTGILDVEMSRLSNIAGQCACCARPCCDYCRVVISWSINATASREVSGIEENVAWSMAHSVTYNRKDDSGAGLIPPTFRVQTGEGDDTCQLVPNGGAQRNGIAGTFSYEKLDDEGATLEEDDQLIVSYINAFDINLGCQGNSLEDAGEPGIPISTVNLELQGEDELGLPADMPACWSGYSGVLRALTFTDGVGTYSSIVHGGCSGWDSSSLSETLVVTITTCEALGLNGPYT